MRCDPSDWLRPPRFMSSSFQPHPLEADSAELYGPPDGYLSTSGIFNRERKDASDKAVYEIEMQPEDGLYPLPYMARQKDGSAWEDDTVSPLSNVARQPFYPMGRAASRKSIGLVSALTVMPV